MYDYVYDKFKLNSHLQEFLLSVTQHLKTSKITDANQITDIYSDIKVHNTNRLKYII